MCLESLKINIDSREKWNDPSPMKTDSVDVLISRLEDLRIQEAAILRDLKAARLRESREKGDASCDRPRPTETTDYRIGDIVEITNKIKAPFGRSLNIGDRRGQVVKITRKRVFLQTENGSTTNRAPHNLRLISEQE